MHYQFGTEKRQGSTERQVADCSDVCGRSVVGCAPSPQQPSLVQSATDRWPLSCEGVWVSFEDGEMERQNLSDLIEEQVARILGEDRM